MLKMSTTNQIVDGRAQNTLVLRNMTATAIASTLPEIGKPIFLSTPDAAKYLNLGASTLEQYRVHGGGPKFYKIGPRKVRYAFSDLVAWLENRLVTSTADANERGLNKAPERASRTQLPSKLAKPAE